MQVHSEPSNPPKTRKTVTCCVKFRLLMWKNLLIQSRYLYQTIFELLLPIVLSLILAAIRATRVPNVVPIDTHYQPFAINNLDSLRVSSNNRDVLDEWRLVYCPNNTILERLVTNAGSSLGVHPPYGVDNAEQLHSVMLFYKVIAGIEFHHPADLTELPAKLSYTLKFPSESRTPVPCNPATDHWHTNLLYPQFPSTEPRHRTDPYGNVPYYFQDGFLPIQDAIARTYSKTKCVQVPGCNDGALPEIWMQRYPYPHHIIDSLQERFEMIVSLFIYLGFTFIVTNTTRFIAGEKETQTKEMMKMLGLSSSLQWMAWFVRNMIFMIFSISIIVVLLNCRIFDPYVAVFTHSDWTAIWLYLFVYSISLTTFCFMISVFFEKSTTAAAAAALVWILSYVPFFFIRPNSFIKLFVCISLNTAMAYGIEIVVQFEEFREGLQYSNMFQPISTDRSLSVGTTMAFLIVDSIIYLLIALYVEKVMPGKFGVPAKWYFPFTCGFWCGSSKRDDGKGRSAQKKDRRHNFEPEPDDQQVGVEIKNLRKVYSDKRTAVKGITLKMFNDQITVLLGHNGAGKTTTMSMMIGLIPPTSGTAIINGYDIRKNLKEARASIGLCPQHNILFNELTVSEHIEFYARLKGSSKKGAKEEVTRYVKLFELEQKTDVIAKCLYGGMRRRLALVLALCGESKVVFLDEPTAGLDPVSRRKVWDLLQSEKEDRTILLTTHYMDEADVLGDRITIMADGELKCCGSSEFLKIHFGRGYRLICLKADGCNANDVTLLLQKFIPKIEPQHNIGAELSYGLPTKYAIRFEKMFRYLEQQQQLLKIDSFGISMTSLDDVFVKVASESDYDRMTIMIDRPDDIMTDLDNIEAFDDGAMPFVDIASSVEMPEDIKSDPVDVRVRPTVYGATPVQESRSNFDNSNDLESKPNEFEATIKKTVPVRNGFRLRISQWKALFKERYYRLIRSLLILLNRWSDAFLAIYYIWLYRFRTRTNQYFAMFKKRFFCWIRGWKIFLLQLAIASFSIILIKFLSTFSHLPNLNISLDTYGTTVTLLENPGTISDPALQRIYNEYRRYIEAAGSDNTVEEITENIQDNFLKKADEMLLQVNERYLVGLSVNNSLIIAWFNNQPYHTSTLSLYLMHNAMIKSKFGQEFSIELSNHPFPFRLDSIAEIASADASLGFQLAISISIAMAFVSSLYIMFYIKERESQAKMLQLVNGLNVSTYWITSFLFDFATFILISSVMLCTLWSFREPGWSTVRDLLPAALSLIFFGFAVLQIIFFASELFTDPANGFIRMTLFFIITGMIGFLVQWQLSTSASPVLKLLASVIKYIFLLSPIFALSDTFYTLYKLNNVANRCKQRCEQKFNCNDSVICDIMPECCDIGIFGFRKGISFNLIFMLLTGVVCFTVLLLREYRVFEAFSYKIGNKQKPQPKAAVKSKGKSIDFDVDKEKKKVEQMTNDDIKTYNLVLKNLTKFYGDFSAVNQLSIALKSGESFGLVGVNGAGKSATFRMLTGEEEISSGDAYVRGISLKSDMIKVHKMIGYCPQSDALLEELTGAETLEIFARIRGYHVKDTPPLTYRLATDMKFLKHLNKRVGDYSAGNKRKLSTAIALVGNPDVVYLDEPTTGMDPAAKRSIWEQVLKVRSLGKTIILTSHSMEECETLCTRLAIMVNGELISIGSSQHLKSKFGKGFILTLKIQGNTAERFARPRAEDGQITKVLPGRVTKIKEFIIKSFPSAVIKDEYRGFLTFHVPPTENSKPWSAMFGLLEDNKRRLHIEDYSVSQASVEQVFLHLVRSQKRDQHEKDLCSSSRFF